MLALKMNHKRFHHKVERLFASADELQFNAMVYRKESENDYGHNRVEGRRYTILPSMYLPRYQKEWKDCQAFIRVESTRYLLGQKKEEASYRYYITSLRLKQSHKMCEAIRGHWGIENGLHHKLDVGLHEDDSPIYRGHAAQNLAIMRKIVFLLIQKDKSNRGGIDLRRKAAGFSTRYLRKVIGL